jgi:beta-glucosidase
MKGRTYRYFEGKPLYPFGHGLSYTTFSYRGLHLVKKTISAGDPLIAEVAVANTGKREGDEIVQLYLSFPDVPGAPLRALRGFKHVRLKPGESQNVRFELKDRDLSMVTEAGEPIISEGKYSLSIGGGQHRRSERSEHISGKGKQDPAGIGTEGTRSCIRNPGIGLTSAAFVPWI